MSLTRKSIFLSKVLRHNPEIIGTTLDEHGWADVQDILKGLDITKTILDVIVETDEKHRYSYNEDETKIRANQGHSVNVNVELEIKTPPADLYHGTSTRNYDKIWNSGFIKRMNRQYIHLSADIATAIKVGRRHGAPAVIRLDTERMSNDGIVFYQSSNGVWLVKDDIPMDKYFVSEMEGAVLDVYDTDRRKK